MSVWKLWNTLHQLENIRDDLRSRKTRAWADWEAARIEKMLILERAVVLLIDWCSPRDGMADSDFREIKNQLSIINARMKTADDTYKACDKSLRELP